MDWKAYAQKLLLSPAVWVGAVKLADAVVFAVWPTFPVSVSDAAQYFIFGIATALTGVQINDERKLQAHNRLMEAQGAVP